MRFTGRVHASGPRIDTGGIIPASYLMETRPQELAKHVYGGRRCGSLASPRCR